MSSPGWMPTPAPESAGEELQAVMGWLGRGIGAVAALLLVVALAEASRTWRTERALDRIVDEQQAMAPTDTTVLGPMPPELAESSGLAVSRAHPGVIWTHNDSGDRARFYQLDTTAALVATFDLRTRVGDAIDWEAMDLGPCPGRAGEDCLYIADVGDNERRRERVAIHIVPEPDPATSPSMVDALASIVFRYPDQPHDAEGVAVSPEGDIVIVTKGRTGSIDVFTLPAAEVAEVAETPRIVTLAEGVRLPITPIMNVGRAVTGAAIDGAGEVLAVRTYLEVFFFDWPLGPAPTPTHACFLGRLEPQGEAIAFWTDGRMLLTSEAWPERRGSMVAVRCAGR